MTPCYPSGPAGGGVELLRRDHSAQPDLAAGELRDGARDRRSGLPGGAHRLASVQPQGLEHAQCVDERRVEGDEERRVAARSHSELDRAHMTILSP